MRKILTLLAVTLCAAACIYPYTPELEEAPEGVLTVDGNVHRPPRLPQAVVVLRKNAL